MDDDNDSKRLPPVRVGSGFSAESRARLERATAKAPIEQRDTPDAPPRINSEQMMQAWEANVDTQREIIRVVEKNEANNDRMHQSNVTAGRTSIVVLLVMLISSGFAINHAQQTLAAVHRIEVGMRADLLKLRAGMASVADAMAALNEAEVMASNIPSDHPLDEDESAKAEQAVRFARKVALAKALKAQAALVDELNAPARRAAEQKEAIRVRAAEAGVPID